MAVLERADLEASPLADLHAIADQLGLDGFRRLRKADLVDAILGEEPSDRGGDDGEDDEARDADDGDGDEGAQTGEAPGGASTRARRRGGRARRTSTSSRSSAGGSGRRARGGRSDDDGPGGPAQGAIVEGVVELLDNGSAFLRVSGSEPSDDDVYISAAQVRRCELVSGDRVSGPMRAPRRSERYPSLVRVEEINGEGADRVSEAVRYEDLPVSFPSDRITFGAADKTLEAIEWLAPIGRGSRALIVGAARAGKSATLRRMLAAVASEEELTTTLVLLGTRPEEIAWWSEGPLQPASALTFAASADAQGQALERAIDEAKRIAARGSNALVLIDGLDGVHPHAARKALAAARNLSEAGSLTVIATAARPFGGESTVIALDAALASAGREPTLDLLASGTVRAELLVGEDGAQAITRARAAALDAAG
jgi:transcription termination factor Rho